MDLSARLARAIAARDEQADRTPLHLEALGVGLEQQRRRAQARVDRLERSRHARPGVAALGVFVRNVHSGAVHRSDCLTIVGDAEDHERAEPALEDVGCFRCRAQVAAELRGD